MSKIGVLVCGNSGIDYIKHDYDSIDLTLHYIYYPLPYVKEIFIKDWKGGWETEQSYLHLEYWDDKWRVENQS